MKCKFVCMFVPLYVLYVVALLHVVLHQALIQKGFTSELKTQTMSSLPPPQWRPYCIVA